MAIVPVVRPRGGRGLGFTTGIATVASLTTLCLDGKTPEHQDVADFLQTHLDEVQIVSPRDSRLALDLEGLREADITFWTVREGGRLIGCGALRELSTDHGEVKSMRVGAESRGKGFASALLAHMLRVAQDRGYTRVSLETGSVAFFEAARRLYRKFGFQPCTPFAGYREDPESVFLSMEVGPDGT